MLLQYVIYRIKIKYLICKHNIMSSSFYVYLLECSDNSTYIGATVNLDHRLRQHNKEIKGGAVATSNKVKKSSMNKSKKRSFKVYNSQGR